MRKYFLISLLFITPFFLAAQQVEVIGELKISTVTQDNSLGEILVKDADGVIKKRDASSLSAIPSTAIVLSETEANTILSNAGFTLIGVQSTSFAAASANGSWSAISATNEPTARRFHIAVWTGTEMIIWGGQDIGGTTNTGGKYNPVTDTWNAMSTVNAPLSSTQPSAVWTGSELIIWNDDSFSNSGALYDPVADTWSPMSLVNAPDPSSSHTAIWTGSEMIVWGGETLAGYTNEGGKYDPSTDTWSSISLVGAPDGRRDHTAIWTGSEMVIWGGFDGIDLTLTGARFNPVTDTWSSTSLTNAPSGRSLHTATWSGSEMIVWGGYASGPLDTGGKYDPITDSWSPTSMTGVPQARGRQTAIWKNNELMIWGGNIDSNPYAANGGTDTGGKYSPSSDSWIDTNPILAPIGRYAHAAIWTGSEMIVWGGWAAGSHIGKGGKYDPATVGYSSFSNKLYYMYQKN